MGQAKRRGTYEERVELAKAKLLEPIKTVIPARRKPRVAVIGGTTSMAHGRMLMVALAMATMSDNRPRR